MSGPVTAEDVPADCGRGEPDEPEVEVTPSRKAEVGGFMVRRALPRRGRRTVGAWCFVDHMGPGAVTDEQGLDVGPHPHIGLQTVTWLLDGELLHRDSLGSEQVIRPGQLNLMTAGHGVSHSEESTGYRGTLHGVQLWIAQPSATRDDEPAFEHHAELPQVELAGATARILVGELDGTASPARHDTELVGVDIELRGGTAALPLRSELEHAIVVMDGALEVDGNRLEPGHLGYLGEGRDELAVSATDPTRALLVGGVPFPEQVLMWWNYVARDRDEVAAAHREWTGESDRFGQVDSALERIVVGPPPWAASAPRPG